MNARARVDADERAARFIGRAEEHDGIPLQVVENTGAAGDVMLLHPLVLHVATPNKSAVPRLLLSGASIFPRFGRCRRAEGPLSPARSPGAV
ncbi:MAG TPA: hypothetical protein VFV10_17700, partial [Gammaproteobacteria bacterium]|nr:hypothetical protein [Gammaproteobacteria bacterium]